MSFDPKESLARTQEVGRSGAGQIAETILSLLHLVAPIDAPTKKLIEEALLNLSDACVELGFNSGRVNLGKDPI